MSALRYRLIYRFVNNMRLQVTFVHADAQVNNNTESNNILDEEVSLRFRRGDNWLIEKYNLSEIGSDVYRK